MNKLSLFLHQSYHRLFQSLYPRAREVQSLSQKLDVQLTRSNRAEALLAIANQKLQEAEAKTAEALRGGIKDRETALILQRENATLQTLLRETIADGAARSERVVGSLLNWMAMGGPLTRTAPLPWLPQPERAVEVSKPVEGVIGKTSPRRIALEGAKQVAESLAAQAAEAKKWLPQYTMEQLEGVAQGRYFPDSNGVIRNSETCEPVDAGAVKGKE